MHTKKTKIKYTPPKAAAIRLTLSLFPMCTKPRARYQNSDPRTNRNAPISKRFLLPNITYILIIHSGPVARTVPIYKNPRARLIYITIRVNQI